MNPNNTTFSLVGNLNFVDFVDPSRVKSLFGKFIDPVISQIETSKVEPTLHLGFNKNMVDQRKISPEKEHSDAPLSPQKDPPRYIYVKNPAYMERQGENEDHDKVRNEEGEGENRTEATFRFPILDTIQDATIKNIPPSSLPTFYGKNNEDPDTFLFNFDVLCMSYNYL